MEMYQKAYEHYKTICEEYGMESMNYHQFIKQLTDEQLTEFSKCAS
ncbi:hypothetical protein [Niallia oryzisoli]